jgi:hypothetical protein
MNGRTARRRWRSRASARDGEAPAQPRRRHARHGPACSRPPPLRYCARPRPPLEPVLTSAELHNPETSLSTTFETAADSLPRPTVTVGDLLGLIGEQGLLLFCVFLGVPFLLPVAIPGTSTLFGVLLILVGAGVTANRVPWLPERLLQRSLNSEHVAQVLRRSAGISRRFEHLIRPRLLQLTHGATLNRFNGLVLIFAALLLMAPLPLIPLTNTLPAIGIILLAAGMAERDGVCVIAGYVATAVSAVYIGLLLFAVFWAGSGLALQIREFVGF